MVQGVFVDEVLLKLNGGILNTESAVKREDIRAYIAPAVNWAMMKSYYLNLQSESNRDFPSQFYGTFSGLAITRPAGARPYFVLPKGYVPLPSNQGIRFVTDGCDNTYIPLQDSDMALINYYSKQLSAEKFYRPSGNQVQLIGLPRLMNEITAVVIIDSSQLTDDDVLPIQAGQEVDAINVCVEFFTGQRQLPGDKVNNKADINVA